MSAVLFKLNLSSLKKIGRDDRRNYLGYPLALRAPSIQRLLIATVSSVPFLWLNALAPVIVSLPQVHFVSQDARDRRFCPVG
jgi:hypothetical protein